MNGQAQDANAIPFQSDALRWAEGQRVSILAASWPSLLAIVGVPSRDSSIMIHGFLLANGSFTTIDVPGANAALPSGIDAACRIARGLLRRCERYRGGPWLCRAMER